LIVLPWFLKDHLATLLEEHSRVASAGAATTARFLAWIFTAAATLMVGVGSSCPAVPILGKRRANLPDGPRD